MIMTRRAFMIINWLTLIIMQQPTTNSYDFHYWAAKTCISPLFLMAYWSDNTGTLIVLYPQSVIKLSFYACVVRSENCQGQRSNVQMNFF